MFDFLDNFPWWVGAIVVVIGFVLWVRQIAGSVFDEKIQEYPTGIDEDTEAFIDELEQRIEQLEAKLKK